MISLFLDTHSSDLNIGVVKSKTLDEIKLKDLENHSNLFLSKVDEILKKNDIEPREVDRIVVVNGPGSFTGIRIAVTCAKVYAYMLNKEITTISSLKAYALSTDNYDYIVPLIDARRGYVYGAIYDKNLNEVQEESYISFDELMGKVSKLNGVVKYIGNYTNNNIEVIKPNLDILNIVDYSKKLENINPHLVNPNYLKKTEAEEKND